MRVDTRLVLAKSDKLSVQGVSMFKHPGKTLIMDVSFKRGMIDVLQVE